MFTAVVRITGAGRLDDFRERLRWLMVRDEEAEAYTEHHGEGRLEYRFEPKKGIPFPAFSAASVDFPELRVEAEWERDGVRGRAVIESGRLVQDERGDPGMPGVEVEVSDDGRLVLGLAVRDGIGYAVTSDRQTYFRYRDGVLTLVSPDDADAALEDVAFAFAEEWLWYDEQEALVERARYAGYGYAVRGANVKSEKLALLRARGMRYSSLEPTAASAREAIVERWLSQA
ncbi:MAG TPA: hypothetical protein VFC18_11545 [Burkholderiales bacterium]|nr:hypothetical protein [Burkholderiales bacterium]